MSVGGQSNQYRRELARLQEKEAQLLKEVSRYEIEYAKETGESHKKHMAAEKSSSLSTKNSYLTAAGRAQKKAAEAQAKCADVRKKLATNARDQASKKQSLEAAEKSERKSIDKAAARRRSVEKKHAVDLSKISPFSSQLLKTRIPAPEKLRVLYLTANPVMDLRTDIEVRQVLQAIRGAKHRDLVEIAHRPAATFQDLLDGLNDVRPHVIHFSGHGGGRSLLFDNGAIDGEDNSHPISFEILKKALKATDHRPDLLVMNACDTTDGSADIMECVPAVISMKFEVSDLAAILFASQLYAAIASGQSIDSSFHQAKVKVEVETGELSESEPPQLDVRDDFDATTMVLVMPPS